MRIPPSQRTLQSSISVSGVGLHSGEVCGVELRPAPPDTGIVFELRGVRIPAALGSKPRAECWTTELGSGAATVVTTEHFLAACFGIGLTNCEVSFKAGSELPILDGAAAAWLALFERAGIVDQPRPAPLVVIDTQHEFKHQGALYRVSPGHELTVKCTIDFPNTPIGSQSITYYHSRARFCGELSRCRTFLKDPFLTPACEARANSRLQGLAAASQLTSPVVKYTDREFLVALRTELEPVGHKLLDFLGDLYLAGSFVIGHFEIERPGHRGNIAFLEYLIGAAGNECAKRFSHELDAPADRGLDTLPGLRARAAS